MIHTIHTWRRQERCVSCAARMGAVALGTILAVAAAACSRSSDGAEDVAVDTLGLLDRELDLAMSAESAAPELRDVSRPVGTPGRPTSAQPPSLPPSPPSHEAADAPSPTADAPSSTKGAGEPDVSADGSTETRDPGTGESPPQSRSVAAGLTFEVTLNQELGTRHNRVGDLFSATLKHPLTDGRVVVVPAGALVIGEVTALQESGGHGQEAMINLEIQEVSFDGSSYPLDASIVEAHPETRGRSSTGAKAAKIGGAAAAGAILGRVIGGDALGTIIGAAAGGAAGTAIVLGTEDVDAVLPRGSTLVLRLDEPLQPAMEVP